MTNPANANYDYLCKLLVLGARRSGKTSFIMRHCDDAFPRSRHTSLGLDFRIKNIEYNPYVVKYMLWEFHASERISRPGPSWYRDVRGIILLYDVCKADALDQIRFWLGEIEQYVLEERPIFLVANKVDTNLDETQRQISQATGMKIAREFNLHYYEASPRDSVNVNEIIHTLVKQCVDDLSNPPTSPVDQHVDVDAEIKPEENENEGGGKYYCSLM